MKKLNDNFFIYKDGDEYFLTNLDDKNTYLLDKEVFDKLSKEDVDYQPFQDAGIIKDSNEPIQKSIFSKIVQIFLSNFKIKDENLEKEFDFWRSYLEMSQEDIKNIKLREKKEYKKYIQLPDPKPAQGSLHEAFERRRTIRDFTYKDVSLQELSDILFIGYGKFHLNFGEKYLDFDENFNWRRAAPSAGGLNCINAYLFIKRVPGVPVGLYFYDNDKHQLCLIEEKDYEEKFVENIMKQEFGIGSAFTIFNVADFHRVSLKYRDSKSFAIPFLDNGHILQNIILSVTNMKLEYWMTTALCDEYFERIFNLTNEFLVVSAIFIGHGHHLTLGPKNIKKIEEIINENAKLAKMLEKEKVLVKEKEDEKQI